MHVLRDVLLGHASPSSSLEEDEEGEERLAEGGSTDPVLLGKCLRPLCSGGVGFGVGIGVGERGAMEEKKMGWQRLTESSSLDHGCMHARAAGDGLQTGWCWLCAGKDGAGKMFGGRRERHARERGEEGAHSRVES